MSFSEKERKDHNRRMQAANYALALKYSERHYYDDVVAQAQSLAECERRSEAEY